MEVSGGIVESSSSTSTLQNLLPSIAYELECPRGQGAHYIPGHPPQCRAGHDIRRILSCQPCGSKKAPSPLCASVYTTMSGVVVPITNLVFATMRLKHHWAQTAFPRRGQHMRVIIPHHSLIQSQQALPCLEQCSQHRDGRSGGPQSHGASVLGVTATLCPLVRVSNPHKAKLPSHR